MAKRTIFVNSYIPSYPIYKDTLHDTLLRNKYQNINENKKEYFSEAKIVNFDIINNECHGDPLQNSVKYYETIHKENLQRAKEEDREEFIAETIRSKREDLYIKNVLNEHFKLTQELIEFKLKNQALFSSMHGRKKKNNNNNNNNNNNK